MVPRHPILILASILFLLSGVFFVGDGVARAAWMQTTGDEPGADQPGALWKFFLPLVSMDVPTLPPGEPEERLFCSAPGLSVSIPDNTYPGVSVDMMVDEPRLIWDLNVAVDIEHSWVGDLIVELFHVESGKSISVIQRPGAPEVQDGCNRNDVYTILDDELTLGVENECASTPAAISGIFTPQEALSAFDGDSLSGTWILSVADRHKNDFGRLTGWCLQATVNNVPPDNPPPPPSPELPGSAYVQGVSGQNQKYHLDCETRVAVDWAAFFGVQIGEDQFFNRLPASDNPDLGFVGDVHGSWGQIPPRDYGIHAEPVAELLRMYGVEAYAHRPLSWDRLRQEIASGRPVYVWVIGSGTVDTSIIPIMNGIPVLYTALDGHTSVVASYEHTVMVTGYDTETVIISDGAKTYSIPVGRFLRSWSALGNMAITATP